MLLEYFPPAVKGLDRREARLADSKLFEKAEDEDEWTRWDFKEACIDEEFGIIRLTKQRILREREWIVREKKLFERLTRKANKILGREALEGTDGGGQ